MREMLKNEIKRRRHTHILHPSLSPSLPHSLPSPTYVLHTSLLPDRQSGLRSAVQSPGKHFSHVAPSDILDG